MSVINVLVLGSQSTNFYYLLDGIKLSDGSVISVEQATWNNLNVKSEATKVVVQIHPSASPIHSNQHTTRVMTPDLVLMRAGVKGDFKTNWFNTLMAFVHAGVPCINSATSFLRSQEKAGLYGALNLVMKRLGGFQEFPLIPQSFYPNYRSMYFVPDLPCVLKVGTASSGLGKMKIANTDDWEDFRGVLAMSNDYVTAEGFINWDVDIRIQQIGSHFRVFERKTESTGWKINTAMQMTDVEVPITDEFRRWMSAVAFELDMDIFALDVVRDSSTGQHYILEVNPSSIGLNPKTAAEDAIHIRDLVLRRLERLLESEAKPCDKALSDRGKRELELEDEVVQLNARVKELEAMIATNAALQSASTKKGTKKKGIFVKK